MTILGDLAIVLLRRQFLEVMCSSAGFKATMHHIIATLLCVILLVCCMPWGQAVFISQVLVHAFDSYAACAHGPGSSLAGGTVSFGWSPYRVVLCRVSPMLEDACA